jgi:hypothetical protein
MAFFMSVVRSKAVVNPDIKLAMSAFDAFTTGVRGRAEVPGGEFHDWV